MLLPNRFGSTDTYRYAFNGKEKDDEIKGGGNSYNFGSRTIYDPRIGRFNSVDPDDRMYPSMSPYVYSADNPILFIDKDGRGPIIPKSLWKGQGSEVAYMAGILNSMSDDASSLLAPIWKLYVLGVVGADYYWELYGKEDKAMYDAAVKLINDVDARKQVINQFKEQIQDYGEDLAGLNGDEEAAYARGQLDYNVVTASVGVGELTTLVKTGKWSENALKILTAKVDGSVKVNGFGLGYIFKKGIDLDWRGTGLGYRDALNEVFDRIKKKTGVDRDSFEVTKWGKNQEGKSIPVEYKGIDPNGNSIEVSVDFAHKTKGTLDAPHVGYKLGKKKTKEVGHIILDDVPAGRTDKLDKS